MKRAVVIGSGPNGLAAAREARARRRSRHRSRSRRDDRRRLPHGRAHAARFPPRRLLRRSCRSRGSSPAFDGARRGVDRPAGPRRARARRRRRDARAHARRTPPTASAPTRRRTARSSSRSCARGRGVGRAGISLRLRPSLVRGLLSARAIARLFTTERGRALFAGNAAHSVCRSSARATRGLRLRALRRRARRRLAVSARRLAGARRRACRAAVGARRRDRHVEPRRRAAACRRRPLRRRAERVRAPRAAAAVRARLPSRAGSVQARLGARRTDPVDERRASPRRRPSTSAGLTARSRSRSARRGRDAAPASGRSSSLVQHSLFDASRAPAGKHTAWAYCHVPHRLGGRRDGRDRGAGRALRAGLPRPDPRAPRHASARLRGLQPQRRRRRHRRRSEHAAAARRASGSRGCCRGARRSAASTSARRRRRRAAACTDSAGSPRRASRYATSASLVAVPVPTSSSCRAGRRLRPPPPDAVAAAADGEKRDERERSGEQRCGRSSLVPTERPAVRFSDAESHGKLDAAGIARADLVDERRHPVRDRRVRRSRARSPRSTRRSARG